MKQHYLKKKEFYSNLNLEDITDANYIYAKIVCKDFEIRHFWDYYDLYLKSDTLLLAVIFENFRDICLGIYELDTVKFISPPGLTWQVALKKRRVELDLSTGIDMLLMVGKGVTGGICNAVHCYAKAYNNYINDYDENKESSDINYCDVNNLFGFPMMQKL